jgi:choline dehydrogenase-like flavoprotein
VLFDLNSSIGQAIPLGTADVIIVGAGAVGICTAVELARAGRRVVVLEAGPKSVSKESQAFFESASCCPHGSHRVSAPTMDCRRGLAYQ